MGPVQKLLEMGLEVQQLAPYHFRVEHRIDFWLPRGQWHELGTNQRGQKPLDQLAYFIARRLGRDTCIDSQLNHIS